MNFPQRIKLGGLGRALPALMVRGGGLGLQFLMSVVVARVLGAEGMGLYTLYLTWMVLFGDLVSLGMPIYALRTVAALRARDQDRSIASFVRRALVLVLALGGLFLLLPWWQEALIANWITGDARLAPAFECAAVGAWFFVGMRILAETLKGTGATQRGIFVESATIPLVVLSVLPVLVWRGGIDSVGMLWLHVTAVGVAFALAAALWQARSRRFGDDAGGESVPAYSPALWSMWGGTLLNIVYVSLPLMLLPWFATVAEVGHFGVAFRLMNLVTVVMVTLTAVYGPQFAAAYALRDVTRLRLLMKRSQQISLLLIAPFLAVFTLGAEPVLGLFGSEFRDAKVLLWILAVGQLFNAGTGLIGYMLNMMHQERTEFLILLGTVGLMLVGMIAVGSVAGAVGVTLVYSGGLILKNLLSVIFALRYLNRLETST
ncbi:MAG: oligosaccharide flippase family protein [Candidatus Contendobacter sp.]|nr:oligosaccharide flippase family protein [Candidatus Contendobacter sp.]